MKQKLRTLILSLGLIGFLMAPIPALAADVISPGCAGHSGAAACRGNNNQAISSNGLYGPNGLLTRVAKLIARVVGIAAIIMIMIGGFKYITASGDPSNTKSAQDTILFAVIGIVVAILAQSIVVFVLSRL